MMIVDPKTKIKYKKNNWVLSDKVDQTAPN